LTATKSVVANKGKIANAGNSGTLEIGDMVIIGGEFEAVEFESKFIVMV
jgi:hypothetical protein